MALVLFPTFVVFFLSQRRPCGEVELRSEIICGSMWGDVKLLLSLVTSVGGKTAKPKP